MSNVTKMETRNTDIQVKDRRSIAMDLQGVLQKTYEMLLATQLVHWNARGEHFLSIHKLTEEHYKELFESLDVIAERIRALGAEVPVNGAKKEFSISTKLNADNFLGMVKQLVSMHEIAASGAREVALGAEEADDIVTNDMLVDCINFHEKAVWMLRAIIEK